MGKKRKTGSDRQLSFDFGNSKQIPGSVENQVTSSSSAGDIDSYPERSSKKIDLPNSVPASEVGTFQSTGPSNLKVSSTGTSKFLTTDIVIGASAGTGKTFRLSNRYIYLMATGVDPKSILATTFTKKAAGEILERIAGRLIQASLSEKEAAALSGNIELELSCLDYQKLLKELTGCLNALQIGTLDSFFSQIARNFCFELDLPHSWSIIKDQDEKRILNRAISQTLAEEDILTLMRLMTKGEAGRGVGNEVRRIVNSLNPIFQRSSQEAWELELPSGSYKEVDLDSWRQLIDAINPQEKPKRLKAALQTAYQLLEAGNWDAFFTQTVIKNCVGGEGKFDRAPVPDPVLGQIVELSHQVKRRFVRSVHERNVNTYKFLEKFDNHYRQLKSAQGDLTFNNVQDRLANWIGQLNEPSDKLVARLDFHIKHLLLDEFQDTVPNQWKILHPVADRIFSKTSDRSSGFFCVGDQKQAIYRWRGGDSRIFASVENSFPSIQTESMSASYRSSNVILGCVNEVFTHLDKHDKSETWGEVADRWNQIYDPHLAAGVNKDLSGYAELREISYSEDQQTDVVVQAVAQTISRQRKLRPGCSIGVLVPKNDQVAQVIAQLQQLGIDASEEVKVPVSDSSLVSVLISILQLLDYPNDSASFFHLLTSDLDSKILDCFLESEKRAFLEKTDSIIDRNQDRRFLSWVDQQREDLIRLGYGKVVGRWAEALMPFGSVRDKKKLEHAVAAAYSYDLPLPLRPSEFGRFLEEHKREDPTSDPIRVMNIHQSKGLEFDIVILAKLDAKMVYGGLASVFDHQPDLNKPPVVVSRYVNESAQELLPKVFKQMYNDLKTEVYHEHLCKLYVAMTRARRSLFMILSKKEKEGGRKSSSGHVSSLGGILKATLWKEDDFPEDSGEILYQVGDPDWGISVQEQPESSVQSKKKKSKPKPEKIKLAPCPAGFSRGLARRSPSGLEGESSFSLLSLLKTKDRSTALLKGEVIHGWFELVNWLDEGLPVQKEMIRQAKEIETDETRWKHWIEEFQLVAKQDEVQRVLSRSFYLQPSGSDWPDGVVPEFAETVNRLVVQNERPFAITDKEGLLTGFVDRLVFGFDGDKLLHVDILDYKTDRFDEKGLDKLVAKKVDHYRPQLEAYRQAISKLTNLPLKQITARLLFLSIDRTELI